MIALVIGGLLVITVLLGWIELRNLTPLVFWCGRCKRHFVQPPHYSFPSVCPRCRSRDWNAGPPLAS